MERKAGNPPGVSSIYNCGIRNKMLRYKSNISQIIAHFIRQLSSHDARDRLKWTRQLVSKASRPQNGFSVHNDARWLFFNNANVSLGFQTRAAVGRLNRKELINK